MPAPTLPLGTEVPSTPAARPTPTTLTGRYCTLRPLDPARDAALLYERTHGPEGAALWAYLPYGPFADEAAFRQWMETNALASDPLFFAIEVDGKIVGQASFLRITPEHRTIEVGHIMYSPWLQRTPAATEAMYLMARHVFDSLGYRRYEWKCNHLNVPSHTAALRLGFTFEGTFRQHLIVKGRNRDTDWLSMLDTEWPACKAAFERWLAPENFDAQGRQLASLAALRA